MQHSTFLVESSSDGCDQFTPKPVPHALQRHFKHTSFIYLIMVLCLNATGSVQFYDVIATLTSLLNDGSSQSSRLAVVSLKTCLTTLLRSEHSDDAVRLLNVLLPLHSTPYWLIRVRSHLNTPFVLTYQSRRKSVFCFEGRLV